MRELIYKNLTSNDLRKRDFIIAETVERNGVIMNTERRCIYLVREILSYDPSGKFAEVCKLQEKGTKKRTFHVWKKREGDFREKLICQVFGELYAVIGQKIFHIGFMHSLKIDFETVEHHHQKKQ